MFKISNTEILNIFDFIKQDKKDNNLESTEECFENKNCKDSLKSDNTSDIIFT